MKVMLINPTSKFVQSSWACKRFLTPIAPLGIIYIASVIEKKGIEVTVIDQFAQRLSDKDLLQRIKDISPDVIGFSCLTPVMSNVSGLVREIRSLNRNIKIVLGNTHASLFSEELLKAGMADIIVHGEGEFSLCEAILAIDQNKSLRGISGVSFMEEGLINNDSSYRRPLEDLDDLPFPDWDLLDLRHYKHVPMAAIYNGIAMPIMASRGCKFSCLYCAQDVIHKKPRYRKTKNVIDEIEHVHERYNVKYFGFLDAVFPFSINHGLDFCEELIKRKLHKKIKWCVQMRADMADLELLKIMKKAGLHLIMYGFEAGNQKILDNINKNITLEQSRKAMEYTKKSGILTLGFFILGLPGDTIQTCKETIKFAKELDCDISKFNMAIPYPGSKFFNDCYKDKKIKIDDVGKFSPWLDWTNYSGELAYVPEGMKNEELIALQRKGMLELYLRPRIIIRSIFKGTISLGNIFLGGSLLLIKYFHSLFNKISIIPKADDSL